MKTLTWFLVIVLAFATFAYPQTDSIGPGIYLPGAPGLFAEDPVCGGPGFDPIVAGLGFEQFEVLMTLDGTKKDPPIKPPPPKGAFFKPSATTKTGTDYWQIIIKWPDGSEYDIYMQLGMYAGTDIETKCDKIAEAINYVSDNHPSGKDPVDATVNSTKKRVDVIPKEGCGVVQSSELKNGTGETDNETGEIPGEPEEVPTKTSEVKLNALCYLHSATGFNLAGQQSTARIGYINDEGHPVTIQISLSPGDTHWSILGKFKKAFKFLGIPAKLGTDQHNRLCLMWEAFGPILSGTDDLGLEEITTYERVSKSLHNGGVFSIGTWIIILLSVDPDEAMPHYVLPGANIFEIYLYFDGIYYRLI